MAKFLVLLLLTAATAWTECVTVAESRDGSIDALAFSSIGKEIVSPRTELIDPTTNKIMRSSRGRFERVPYGTYVIRVSAPGFRSEQREIRVNQSELTVRFQLGLGRECGDYSSLKGSVSPVDGSRELWLKVIPLRGSGGAEYRVGRKGYFLVSGLTEGEYVVLVLEGSSVVHTQIAAITGDTNLSIRLLP
jgi:hypothetical protein